MSAVPDPQRLLSDAAYALIDLVSLDGPLGGAGGAGPGAEGRNLDHFCLRIEPFDEPALRAWLSRQGVQASEVAQRFGAEGKGPSLYVSDPDGNVWVFAQPLPR